MCLIETIPTSHHLFFYDHWMTRYLRFYRFFGVSEFRKIKASKLVLKGNFKYHELINNYTPLSQNFLLRPIYKKKFFFYPDDGFYPDISGFLSGPDYPDKNRIIFLIYPDDGFYPDRNTSSSECLNDIRQARTTGEA